MDDFEDDELDDDEEMDEAIGDPRSTDRYSATKWGHWGVGGVYQISDQGNWRWSENEGHPAASSWPWFVSAAPWFVSMILLEQNHITGSKTNFDNAN